MKSITSLLASLTLCFMASTASADGEQTPMGGSGTADNLFSNTEEMVRAAIRHPLAMIASDGILENGKGHPRAAGTHAEHHVAVRGHELGDRRCSRRHLDRVAGDGVRDVRADPAAVRRQGGGEGVDVAGEHLVLHPDQVGDRRQAPTELDELA